MDEPRKRPAVLVFGIVACVALGIAGALAALAFVVAEWSRVLRVILVALSGVSAFASLGSGFLGVLRLVLAFSARPRLPGETLGFVLSAIPLAVAFIGFQVLDFLR